MGKQKLLSLKTAAALCAQEFTVTGQVGSEEIEEKIWVRTLSELEMREAQDEQAALTLAVRKQYASGEVKYEALKSQIEMLSDSELVMMILNGEALDLRNKAEKKCAKLLPFDASAYRTEADRIKAEAEYEKRQEEHAQAFEAAVAQVVEAREAQLLEKGRAELIDTAMLYAVRQAVFTDTVGLTNDFKILYGVYDAENHEERYFTSIDEVRALPATVKQMILLAISQVDAIEAVDIKNSQGRSVLQIGPAETIPEATPDLSTTDLPESASPKKSSRGGRKR